MSTSPSLCTSSRSPKSYCCDSNFPDEIWGRPSLCYERAMSGYTACMVKLYVHSQSRIRKRGSGSSAPSMPCSMAGARRRQLRGTRSSSSSTSSPAPSRSTWPLQRPRPVASSTSWKVATVGGAASASGPSTLACSAAEYLEPRPVCTHSVCVLGCRLFVPLFPLAGALFDMSLPFDYRVAAFEQFTNGTREPSPPRARRQAHACRPA